MNSGSIGSLKNVVGEARIIGFRRLGVVISESLKRQQLSLRDVESLTLKWFADPLNKDTGSRLCNGGSKNPSLNTLNRIAPFCLRVSHFEISNDNPVGVSIFLNPIQYATQLEKNDLMFCQHPEELPDLEYRYSRASDLYPIIAGQIPVKKLLNQF